MSATPDPFQARRDQREEAERRIWQHHGYQEYRLCLAFQRSLNSVFVPNWRELLGLLEQASKDPVLALELIQNVRPPVVREQFHALVTQRLHNYVAGTMTLVEHSRRIMRDRRGPLRDELTTKLAEILLNQEIPFVQDLRNFMLHRSLPFLAHTLSMNEVNTGSPSMTNGASPQPDKAVFAGVSVGDR